MRLAVVLTGRADHAGTTRRDERADALHAAARLILAADELAGSDRDFLVTATRILAEPNAFTTVPGRVRLWIDARTPDGDRLAAWREELAAHAGTLGVECGLTTASRSPALRFDETVRTALGDLPQLVSYAGHDAGILGEKLPAGMVFVRNPTGISHAPEEAVALEDAAVAATALQRALEALK
jgi:N-carbamoyl-L-amino-acid hydrolase